MREHRRSRPALAGIALIGITAAGLVGSAPAAASAPTSMSMIASAGSEPLGNITQPGMQYGKAGALIIFSASNTAAANGYSFRITAPTGTILQSAAVTGPEPVPNEKFTYNTERTVATAPGSFKPSSSIVASVRVPDDANSGDVFSGGSLEVLNQAGIVSNRAVLALTTQSTWTNGPVVADLQVGQEASQVSMTPRREAETTRVQENRSLRHNVWEPTGRFVRAGDQVTVEVPDGVTAAIAGVGTWGGVYANLNDGANLNGLVGTTLKPGANTFAAQRDGMVFLRAGGGDPFDATVSGGVPSPVYVAGQTTNAQLQERIAQFPDSPFVTVIGERVVADFQRHLAVQEVARITDDRVAIWERAVALTDEVYGLDYATDDHDNRSLGRIFLANPDSGAGYANANHERLSFQNSTGAGRDLLTRDASAMWGMWHEIGHTYQTPQYKSWGGGELTVNISAASIQETLSGPGRLDDIATRNKLATFRETPVEERSFAAASDVWLRLVMFDQLRRSFGEQFYPELNRAYRAQVAEGTLPPTGTNAQQEQVFVQIASRIADRDLTPFFAQWGIRPDAHTAEVISGLPALKHEIWNNLDRSTDVMEHQVGGPRTTLGVYQLDTAASSIEPGNTAGTVSFRTHPVGSAAVGFDAVKGQSLSYVFELPDSLTFDPANPGSCVNETSGEWATACTVTGSQITLTRTRTTGPGTGQFAEAEQIVFGVTKNAPVRDTISVALIPAPSDSARSAQRALTASQDYSAMPCRGGTPQPWETIAWWCE